MTGILLSRGTLARYGDGLAAAARAAGIEARALHLPEGGEARLSPTECASIEIAYLTRDITFSEHYRAFGEALIAAPNLKWVHFVNTGVDQHAFLQDLVDRRVRLTTSAGSNADPVAQTAICGLLMLARGLPHWWAAQGRREWAPLRGDALPRELPGQTAVIVGMGTVGTAVARFCQVLGMHVIGVRRSPRRPEDPVHEMHAPAALPELLARCDWLVLACPLTPDTRGMIHSGMLERLPRGAGLVNVARGGLVDERAVIAALRSGRLGGAYLDVFEREPLPADSPLWDLPSVIISPHNASASAGNDDRATRIFLANLVRWAQGRPLQNEV